MLVRSRRSLTALLIPRAESRHAGRSDHATALGESLLRSGFLVLEPFCGSLEPHLGLLFAAAALALGDGLGVGIHVVVDARPGVVDFRVTGIEKIYTIEIQLEGFLVCAFDGF